MNYDLWDSPWRVFIGSRYFVTGTVCKSSAHEATLKIGVILSPLHIMTHPFKLAEFHVTYCGDKILSPQQKVFT